MTYKEATDKTISQALKGLRFSRPNELQRKCNSCNGDLFITYLYYKGLCSLHFCPTCERKELR